MSTVNGPNVLLYTWEPLLCLPVSSPSNLPIEAGLLREQLLFLPEYFHLRCIFLDFENEKEPSTPPLDVSPAGHQISPR